jgi:hypothetical protein
LPAAANISLASAVVKAWVVTEPSIPPPRRDIRQHADFKEALATHDIAEAQVLGDNRRGFLKPSFSI